MTLKYKESESQTRVARHHAFVFSKRKQIVRINLVSETKEIPKFLWSESFSLIYLVCYKEVLQNFGHNSRALLGEISHDSHST